MLFSTLLYYAMPHDMSSGGCQGAPSQPAGPFPGPRLPSPANDSAPTGPAKKRLRVFFLGAPFSILPMQLNGIKRLGSRVLRIGSLSSDVRAGSRSEVLPLPRTSLESTAWLRRKLQRTPPRSSGPGISSVGDQGLRGSRHRVLWLSSTY